MKTMKITYSDIDSQNRQFVWTAYEDGSAISRELTHHCGDEARRTKETWRELHEAGSDTAKLIAAM